MTKENTVDGGIGVAPESIFDAHEYTLCEELAVEKNCLLVRRNRIIYLGGWDGAERFHRTTFESAYDCLQFMRENL